MKKILVCTNLLYLHTVLAYCTTRGQPRTPQGNDSLDLKKKKKKWGKERSIDPIREPLNQRQTAEPPFSQVSPIARDEKLIFIKNAHSCAF